MVATRNSYQNEIMVSHLELRVSVGSVWGETFTINQQGGSICEIKDVGSAFDC